MQTRDRTTIEDIKKEYRCGVPSWFVGFSGGKDSSALLSLVFLALTEVKHPRKEVNIVFCDTGVEIPILREFVRECFRGLTREAKEYKVPLKTEIVRPRIDDNYFVKVIGRGYPPPTDKFRWCTERLRIGPMQRFMRKACRGQRFVVLGLRRGESLERDKILGRCRLGDERHFRQVGGTKTTIYAPIVEYSTDEVWATLKGKAIPTSIDTGRLVSLYESAAGRCPRDDSKRMRSGSPRFGCWTCTVVRKDRTVHNMVSDGHPELAPLLEFRNWLMSIRDNLDYRCRRRRNGVVGLGPFTLDARREILKRLLEQEARTRWRLVSEVEIDRITKLWKIDRGCATYREIERAV
jgi:DNA sulfur modification protein DndC